MSGRIDYEERRQARIDRLNAAAEKATQESEAQFRRSDNLTKDIPLGQPNINGVLTGVMNKSRNAMDKSIEADSKAAYYADRAEAAENNRAISSDDPEAIFQVGDKNCCTGSKKDKDKSIQQSRTKKWHRTGTLV